VGGIAEGRQPKDQARSRESAGRSRYDCPVGSVTSLQSKLPSSGVSIFARMTQLANEHGAVNLSQGFPDFHCEPQLLARVARYMWAGHNQYAPMPGHLVLREALSLKIERLYGRRYDPETAIGITTGATEGLFATLTALVQPGDEVLLFQPCYDSYVPSIRLSGGIPRFVTLRGPDYQIDWDEVRRAVTSRTRVIVINTPHNPTGMIWSAEDMRELEAVLQRTGAIVVSDEVYEHILFDGLRHESVARYPAIAERAVVISSFGKTYHTTGWKVGYCAGPPAIIAEMLNIRQWITFSVNNAAQLAYADMVREDPERAVTTSFYQGRKDLFLSLLEGSRFRPLACHGTFFQLVDYSAITDEADSEFAMRLTREHGVAAIPLSPFLHEGEQPGPVLRFCFAKKDDTLQRAAERLRNV
jgi:methionine transaminase